MRRIFRIQEGQYDGILEGYYNYALKLLIAVHAEQGKETAYKLYSWERRTQAAKIGHKIGDDHTLYNYQQWDVAGLQYQRSAISIP